MGQLYTSGLWIVTPGNEGPFVEAWRDLAEWTAATVEGGTWAKLLQDDSEHRRFLSFGPWPSVDAVQAWRDSDGFRQRVGVIRSLLESFEPRTMHAVVEVGTI